MKTVALFLALLPAAAFSQSARITGTVSGPASEPLEFVNVVLQQAADSSIVKATASDAAGAFAIEDVAPGSYRLYYYLIGYAPLYSEEFNSDGAGSTTVAPVSLTVAGGDLAQVEVAYQRPLVEVRADKTVFNVDGTPNSTGLNGLDLLRRAPGVTIDNNENIIVKGKSGVMVYIDGKPSPLDPSALRDFLKNLQSDQIESIEIITNPSARFDAAGNAGIINIRLKKNKAFGTNGSVSISYATQRYSKYNGSFNINRRTARWNLYGTYGANAGENWNWMDLYRKQNGVFFDQETSSVQSGVNHNFKGGADYFLNDRNTLGVMVSGNLGDNENSNLSSTRIGIIGDESVDSVLIARTRGDMIRNQISYNLNYQYRDTADHVLTADADYSSFIISDDTFQPNTYYTQDEEEVLNENNFRNDQATDISIVSFKTDYEQPLIKGTLSVGVKYSRVKTENDLDFYYFEGDAQILDSLRSNEFDYDEQIRAGYFSFVRPFGKWSIQAGLRVEQTVSDGVLTSFTAQNNEQVERNYTDLFPSAAITWNKSDMHTWNITYSRRIDRPSYQDLNPFEYRLDELSYRRGNAFLQPQYTNVVELSHTFMQFLTSSLSASRTNGFFTEITDTTETSRSYIQPRNLGYQDYIGFNVGSPIPASKWWNIYINMNFYHLYNKATFDNGKTISLSVTSYSFYMQNTFTLPKDWSFELSGWYSGPGVWGGTFKNRPMGGIDAAVKKSLFKGQGDLRIAYGDLLRTMHWRGISQFAGLYIDARGGWESQLFRVSFTWKFGNQQLNVRQRKTGSDDLNRRVK